MRACIIVPAFQAATTIGGVVTRLKRVLRREVFVVDDGSTDRTAILAKEAGARVISHSKNRGKGVALRTGFECALANDFEVGVTVDADDQHPAEEARIVLEASPDPEALVLGIRDLVRDGAPKKNQMSNGISNFFLSQFSGERLRDTQCGLRRYPLKKTVELSGKARGYAFEAEIIVRALAAGVTIVEVPVRVHYPPENERITHFDSVKDPARIVVAVVKALADIHVLKRNDLGVRVSRSDRHAVIHAPDPRAKREYAKLVDDLE